ncbi:hypothetical protein CFOL_v3_16839, partial [Cephalotus follicularis]
YRCLLGHPWIHSSGEIPYSLHQKVKFVVNNQLVCMSRKEDLLVTKSSNTRYIEVVKEALECSLLSFKVFNATYVDEGIPMSSPRLSSASMMVGRMMIERGYQP